MRAMKLSVSVAMAAVLVASEAHAQACTGVPTRDSQLALMGDLSLTDGATGYGASASKNFMGPWTFGAGYTLTSYDGDGPNGNGIDANAAYEVKLRKLPRMSVCPTAGVAYGWVSEGGEKVSSTIIPVGVGLGQKVVDGSNIDMMVYGVPQFMHIRTHMESEALGIDASSSDNAFGGTLGARFASAQFFGGASVSFTTLEGSDAVFGLTLGWIVGGQRQPVQASRAKAAPAKRAAAKPASKTSTARKK
jgi:hypothetical protein